MFCLDCGTQINDDELQCPHCGSSVSEMKERIAEAVETISYTESLGEDRTQKLPLVSKREYYDAEGKPLDPKQAVEVVRDAPSSSDLKAIPQLGSDDPFVTMPIRKVVSSDGAVVVDEDRDAKQFIQPPVKRSIVTPKRIAAVLAVCALCAVCVVGAPYAMEYFNSLVAQSQSAPTATSQTQEPTELTEEEKKAAAQATFVEDLKMGYLNLGAWRMQTDGVVEGLEGYFTVVNRETRTGYSDSCAALIKEVAASRTKLAEEFSAAGITEGQPYYATYQMMDELHGCLLNRLNTVAACWEVSLSFDDPRTHTSEILAPLAQDLEGGNSVSEARFDELYPKADPSLVE